MAMDVKLQRKLDEEGLETITPLPGEVPPPPRKDVFTLSPINKRRWRNFKANRRGFWSLWLFLILFLVSLFAELIANDEPFLVKFDGQIYSPVFNTYYETTFGGEFNTRADYRDPVVKCLIMTGGSQECINLDRSPAEVMAELPQTGWIIWPPIRYSYNTVNLDLPAGSYERDGITKVIGFPSEPTWSLSEQFCPGEDAKTRRFCAIENYNWLGTDDQGRDVVARVIYGFRISVLFGLILAGVSSIIGIIAGAVQGYFGGWVDLLFQRFIEIWTSIPSLYLLIIISAVIEPTFFILLGILLLFSWVALVGVVRAEFLRGRNFEYIAAARALGLSNAKIMFKHLLPNAMVATLTFMPFILNGSITTLTALDFLGFGLPPGSPSLGELLAQGKANLQAPWLGLTAFFVIAIMLSLLIFIGEAVRDALDPRKTFR
jgi:microcin C transport system permease protein